MNYPRYWYDCGDALCNTVFRVSRLKTSDNHTLCVYEGGLGSGKESILIVNPVAASFLLTEKLAASLTPKFRVFSWDTRGAPYLDEQCDLLSVSLDRHARDLAEVLAHSTATPVHCICWCSGAAIAAWAVAHLQVSFRSVSLVAPWGIGNCCAQHQTQFETVFIPLLKRAARSHASVAESVYKLVFEEIRGHGLERAANPVEQDLHRLRSLSNKDILSVQRLARLIGEFLILPGSEVELPDSEMAATFDELCRQTRVLLLHCRDDVTVDYHCSLAASERNPCTQLILYPHGDHFLPFLDPNAMSADIDNFIRCCDAAEGSSNPAREVTVEHGQQQTCPSPEAPHNMCSHGQ